MNPNTSLFDHTNHEVYVVSTVAANKRWGFVATWVLPLTLIGSHRRFLIAISPHNSTWQAIQSSQILALQMLSTEHLNLVMPFGTTSSSHQDKFHNQTLDQRATLPVLAGCVGFVEAKVMAIYEAPQLYRKLVVAETTRSYLNPTTNNQPTHPPRPLTTSYIRTHLGSADLRRLNHRRKELSRLETHV